MVPGSDARNPLMISATQTTVRLALGVCQDGLHDSGRVEESINKAVGTTARPQLLKSLIPVYDRSGSAAACPANAGLTFGSYG